MILVDRLRLSAYSEGVNKEGNNHMNTSSQTECLDCNHPAHEAGQCRQCNCGESAITRTTSYRELTVVFANPDSTLSGYGYDVGHRVPVRRTQ
jgi:hypothetical protein